MERPADAGLSMTLTTGRARSDRDGHLAHLAGPARRPRDDAVAADRVAEPALDGERAARRLGRGARPHDGLAVAADTDRPLYAAAILVDLELGLQAAVARLDLELRGRARGAAARGALGLGAAAPPVTAVVIARLRGRAALVVARLGLQGALVVARLGADGAVVVAGVGGRVVGAVLGDRRGRNEADRREGQAECDGAGADHGASPLESGASGR